LNSKKIVVYAPTSYSRSVCVLPPVGDLASVTARSFRTPHFRISAYPYFAGLLLRKTAMRFCFWSIIGDKTPRLGPAHPRQGVLGSAQGGANSADLLLEGYVHLRWPGLRRWTSAAQAAEPPTSLSFRRNRKCAHIKKPRNVKLLDAL
jgi:hypothetical protein